MDDFIVIKSHGLGVVCGAGVGAAVARRLAEHGFDAVVVDGTAPCPTSFEDTSIKELEAMRDALQMPKRILEPVGHSLVVTAPGQRQRDLPPRPYTDARKAKAAARRAARKGL